MRTIQLIDGRQISPANLGFTTVHEHIVPYDCPDEKREEAIEYCVKRLNHAYSLGVRTIVDVSPRLNLPLLMEVASLTPMQIVACTGFYVEPAKVLCNYSIHDFLSHMLFEAEHGIQGSGVLPGVIKIGSRNAKLEDWEMRALTAAGIAQKETGLPLCVHSVAAFEKQQALIAAGGADLNRVYFSHVEANFGWEGRSFDEEIELMKEVLDRGSYLSFNNFNNWQHTPEDCMANIIKTLANDGYADRLLATMDFVWSFENGKPSVLWEDICEDKDLRDYGYLISHVQPWMRSQGIDEAVIRAMNYDNPVKLFG